jgi:hypothetical protein
MGRSRRGDGVAEEMPRCKRGSTSGASDEMFARGYANGVPYLYRREAIDLQEAALEENNKHGKTHSTPYTQTPRPNLALTYYSLLQMQSPKV